MRDLLNTVIRSGKNLDMVREIEDLEAEYLNNLEASISCTDSYDVASQETYNDLIIVKRILFTFEKLGYLYKDECADMAKYAEQARISRLAKWEGANERNS